MTENIVRTDHTARAFDSDLQEIARKVAEMGGLTERQIADAVRALLERIPSLPNASSRPIRGAVYRDRL